MKTEQQVINELQQELVAKFNGDDWMFNEDILYYPSDDVNRFTKIAEIIAKHENQVLTISKPKIWFGYPQVVVHLAKWCINGTALIELQENGFVIDRIDSHNSKSYNTQDHCLQLIVSLSEDKQAGLDR